ncbi:hypothetical protein CK203_038273 [Vitis vinifera]|uniref:Uncharacterized protein n=1 Tax=Vitis vinifera TaxID=29760 RepID=A0A438IBR4_VITVI|nr:hypothetical protein CK203_038273 [Vitis vinifera]
MHGGNMHRIVRGNGFGDVQEEMETPPLFSFPLPSSLALRDPSLYPPKIPKQKLLPPPDFLPPSSSRPISSTPSFAPTTISLEKATCSTTTLQPQTKCTHPLLLRLTLIFSALANRTRYPFLRRYSVWVASILSLAAGAAKEVADEIGFFKSAGASPKDALADLLGVLIACLALSLRKSSRRPDPMDQVPGVSLV